MRNEDLSGLNANSEAQETEETIANLQEAAVRAPVVIRPGAIRVQPDANGVVVLPAEVALGDIAVVGTDLVIELPDGTQWVIVDGAIFVPQLVIGDVEVPPTNLAALLIGEEPEPAAGQNNSSGGNFAVAVPDLGPPQPLGDLLPPTELDYSPPEPDLLGQFIEDDEEPNIVIETPDNPTGAVNATASVNESGLPEGPGLGRDAGESEGSSAAGNGETTSGTFVYFSPDSPNVLAVDGLVVNGVVITGPGQIIEGAHGFLEIIAVRDGEIDFEYTLTDNTNGNDTTDVFQVTVTDADGDSASANLTISIIDDVPNARADEDYIAPGGMAASGNVMTGSGTTTGAAGADTEGADGATVVGATGAGETTDGEGSFMVVGQYGVLTIFANGDYSYARDPLSPGGVEDEFTYTLRDGDGDESTTTLTIVIDDLGDEISIVPDPDGGDTVGEDGLPEGPGVGDGRDDGEPEGSNEPSSSETVTGTITWTDGDGENVIRIDGVIVTGPGQQIPVEGGILTIISYDPDANVIEYSYTLTDNTSGDDTSISFTVTITDADGDVGTDTVTIDIVDDEPEANDDSDTIAAGEYGPETGNVMTGAGTNEGLGGAGADVEGADGAEVSGATGFGSTSVAENGDFVVQGQYGVLTIGADGEYSYVRNEGTAGGVEDVFTYTLTDGDGDSVTATLTIEIEDSGVVVGENATVLVDDDALAGGNPGGTGDDPDGANLSGTLSGSGSDEPIGFAFSTAGAPAGFTYVADGANILIQQGGVTVITVTLDAATGGYTVTQNAPIDHATGGNENNVVFNIGYTVTDVDGDSAGGTLTINADDDTPTVGRTGVAVPDLMVDETNLAANDSASFAGLFSISEGADGGSAVWSLTLSAQGVDSGLVDTATGQSVLLYNNGDGTVEGRTSGSNALVFTVSVDASGTVTLDQVRAVVHPDSPDNYDETIDVDGGAISLTVTVTDGDGDVASQSVDIGGSLNFDDDGPSAGLADEFEAPSLEVDESELGVDDSGNNYAGAFDLEGGADGVQSVEYSFTIVEGADSGLVDTATGQSIYLFTDADGNVEGRVGGEGGAVAFEVRVDAGGNVTLDQVRAIVHPDSPDNYDESVSPTAGSIQLTATVTDGDDDEASATLDISGDLSFADDGPSAELADEFQAPSLVVDETDLSQDDDGNSYAGAFDLSGGADGTKSVVYSFTIVEGADSGLMTTDGTKIFLFTDADGNVEGRVGGEGGAVAFEVSVDANGNVSLDQMLSLQHPDNPDNYDEAVSPTAGSIKLTATITDGDNDTASVDLDISGDISFHDDGPSVGRAEVSVPDLNVDESDLAVDATGVSMAGLFDIDFGADGDGGVDYALTLSMQGADSGLNDTETGLDILLYNVGNGTVEGRVGGPAGAVAFVVSVDASGNVSLDQQRAVVHPDNPDNYNEVVDIDGGVISLTATVTDGDGDQDDFSVDIGANLNFADDGPSIVATGTDGTTGIQVATTSDAEVPDFDLLNLANFFSNTPDGGADGVQSVVVGYSLSVPIAADVPSGLTTGGQPIYLMASLDGSVVQATTGPNGTGSVVFQLDLSGSQVVVQQFMVLDHASGSDSLPLPTGLINANYSATVTDGDGDQATDTASIDLGGNIVFLDDAPMAVDDTDNVTEGSLVPATGNVITDADVGDVGDSDDGADDVGNDTPATVVGIVTGGNDAVDAVTNGGGYPLVIDGDYGTLTINADGSYSYALDNTNPDVNTLPNGATIDDVFTYTIEDADGDRDSATLTITITGENTAPSVTAVITDVSEEGLLNGIEDSAPASDDTNDSSQSGTFVFSDADGDSLTWSISTPVGSYEHADGTDIVWVQVDSHTVEGRYGSEAGAAIVVATIDNDGNWTVDLNGPLNHGADGNTESEFSIVFGIQVDDGTETTDSTLTVRVEDDKPVVTGDTPNAIPELQTDDTDISPDTDSFDYSTSFDVMFGADGPESPVVYTLGTVGGASGLVDTLSGESVVFAMNGNVLEGRTSGTNALVLTIEVNASGVVEMTQLRSVVHDNTNSYDELVLLADVDNLVTLTATATDDDGDFDSHTIDITGNISIRDDGPVFSLATPSSDAGVIVQTSDADLPTDVDTSTASLLPLFGIATQDYGSDQAAAVDAFVDNFALDVVGYGGVNGILSNVTVNDNVPVYLHEIGGKIVGSTAMLTANVNVGNTVFDLSVNNTDGADEGKLTLTQYQAIDHSNGEPVILANNLVTATYSATIKDGDGDTASDSKSIDLGGNVRFADDTPDSVAIVANNSITLDESPVPPNGDGVVTANANFAGSFQTSIDYGNDGAGSVTYALQIADGGGNGVFSGLYALNPSSTGQGDPIFLVNVGGSIFGTTNPGAPAPANIYFVLNVNNSGTVTFTQQQNIWHGNTASNDETGTIVLSGGDTFRLVQTVTDADGDSDSSFVDLNGQFAIQDDGPKAFDPEDAPTIQNSSSGGFTGDLDVLAHINTYTGTDGGTVRFPASLHNTDSGMNYQGVDIVWNVSSDGQTLTGIAGATPILTITLDQGASTYTIDMLLPVDAFTDFQFTDANSDFTGGNGAWFGIVPNGQSDKGTPVDDDSFDVLITGNTGSTINTSGILGGVDTGQSIESGEFIQLDYVIDLRDTGNNGPVGGGYDPATADHIFDSHVPSTNGASVLFQKQSGAPSSFNIKAYDDSDANGNNVRSGADRTQDTINGIIISYDGVSTYNGTANSLITADGIYQINGKTYIVDFKVDGSVDVKGVTAGNNVSDPSTNIAVFTANGYNSLVLENINATDGIVGNDTATIKFGGFGAQIPTTNPVDFSVPIQIVDGDGDVVAGDTMDFSLVASGGSTTMAIEKIALGEPQAANDDFLMVQLDEGRSLMMSSALALGFAAALPAKFAWDGFGDSHVLSADLADFDVPAFGAAMLPGSTATSFAGVSTVSVSLGGDVVGGQSTLVSAQEAIDVSLDSEPAIEDAASAPKGDTAQVAVAEQIAIVDGADVAMPGAEAIAAIVAAKAGGGIDLALVGKEAIIETGEGDVDALLAGIGDGHAGAPEAIATLMVVGQEALDAAYDGYLPANTDALLSDAMLLHMDAAGSAAHG